MRRLSAAFAALTLLLAGCGGSSTTHKHVSPCPNGPYARPCAPHPKGWAVTPPSFQAPKPTAGVATREGFDSILINAPGSAWAVAGYVDGSWPDYGRMVAAYPHAHHLSIGPFARDSADCLDDEPGDATPSEAPGWAKRMINAGHKLVCIYTSISMMGTVKSLVARAGIPLSRIKWWCAWYRYFPGLVNGCDAVQWTDHWGGLNLDGDTFRADFFGPPPPPPLPPDPNNYRFSPTHFAYLKGGLRGGPFGPQHLDERLVRLQTAGALKHAAKYRGYLRGKLAPELDYLAGRLHSLACADKRNGSFNLPCHWGPASLHRGSRYQYLTHAAAHARAGR